MDPSIESPWRLVTHRKQPKTALKSPSTKKPKKPLQIPRSPQIYQPKSNDNWRRPTHEDYPVGTIMRGDNIGGKRRLAVVVQSNSKNYTVVGIFTYDSHGLRNKSYHIAKQHLSICDTRCGAPFERQTSSQTILRAHKSYEGFWIHRGSVVNFAEPTIRSWDLLSVKHGKLTEPSQIILQARWKAACKDLRGRKPSHKPKSRRKTKPKLCQTKHGGLG